MKSAEAEIAFRNQRSPFSCEAVALTAPQAPEMQYFLKSAYSIKGDPIE
jgi:hypothetical protein